MERKDEVKKRKKGITHTVPSANLKKRSKAIKSLKKINQKYGYVLKNLANDK